MKIEKTKHTQTSEIYKLGPVPSIDPKTGRKRSTGGYIYLAYLSKGLAVNLTNMPDMIALEDLPALIDALTKILEVDQQHRSDQGK